MDQRSSSRREKETLPTQETFVSALKNGVILCEMMNVITGFKGRSSKIVIHRQYPPATRQMKERDNIETFLAECRDIGLEKTVVSKPMIYMNHQMIMVEEILEPSFIPLEHWHVSA